MGYDIPADHHNSGIARTAPKPVEPVETEHELTVNELQFSITDDAIMVLDTEDDFHVLSISRAEGAQLRDWLTKVLA